MRFSICQILSIFVIFGLLFSSGIGPDISMVYAHNLVEKTITKKKLYEDEVYTYDVYAKVEKWLPSAGKNVEMSIKIGTRTRTRKIWTGEYDITESTKTVAHTHWYKDPKVLLAAGTLIVSIITLFVDDGGNGG